MASKLCTTEVLQTFYDEIDIKKFLRVTLQKEFEGLSKEKQEYHKNSCDVYFSDMMLKNYNPLFMVKQVKLNIDIIDRENKLNPILKDQITDTERQHIIDSLNEIASENSKKLVCEAYGMKFNAENCFYFNEKLMTNVTFKRILSK